MRVMANNLAFAQGMHAPVPLRTTSAATTDTVNLSSIGKTTPKFGCRLFAYVNAKPTKGQNKLLSQCLMDGQNSLQKQSPLRHGDVNAANVFSWDDLLAKSSNGHGWGVASYGHNQAQPLMDKQPAEAASDSRYEDAADKAIARKPAVLLAHIRAASVGSVNAKNTHPFTYGNWTLMHNGSLYGPEIDRLRAHVVNNVAERLGERPGGETDSEAVFYALLGRLHDQFPDTDALKNGLPNVAPEAVFDTFRNVVGELVRGDNAPHRFSLNYHRVADTTGLHLEESSSRESSPACNFVLTNGRVLMASAYGHKLFLGSQPPSGKNIGANPEVMLASEPIQPKGFFARKINWVEVPMGHAVLMERQSDGVKVTLKPF